MAGTLANTIGGTGLTTGAAAVLAVVFSAVCHHADPGLRGVVQVGERVVLPGDGATETGIDARNAARRGIRGRRGPVGRRR